MKDFKADALLLRSADYGENDKMVTLLTAERGKVGAAMKGVKKAGAKLRFAAQPFCFAEYVLAERGGRYTVTQASLHEEFYELRSDLSRYYAACAVIELADLFSAEGMEAGELLVSSVTALKRVEESSKPALELLVFLLRVSALAGYGVEAETCKKCGDPVGERPYFDFTEGAFTCAACAEGERASPSTYALLHALTHAGGHIFPQGAYAALPAHVRAHILEENSKADPAFSNDCARGDMFLRACEGISDPDDAVRRALRLMRAYLSVKTDARLSSLGQFLSLS